MKYSLRSLMLATIFAPPLLAVLWAATKAAMESRKVEWVYGDHIEKDVTWEQAKAGVEAWEAAKRPSRGRGER